MALAPSDAARECRPRTAYLACDAPRAAGRGRDAPRVLRSGLAAGLLFL